MIGYYARNGFKPIYTDEAIEKEYFSVDSESDLRTRMMYFDLKL